MTFEQIRKSAFLLLGLAMIAALVGCSSSNTTTTHPAVTVSLSSFPTALFVSQQSSISATVTNDSTNGGVSWSCAPSGSCGSFSSTSSASGAAVVYTAPSSVPSGPVTITATSVASTSVAANSSGVTINAIALAQGQYVFSLRGADVNSPYYVYSGTFVVNSSGAITGGEQDLSDESQFVSAEPIASGTITANSDNTLTITLVPTATTSHQMYFNGGAALTLNASLVSTSKALVSEYDTWGSASGELDLQASSVTIPNSGYAFSAGGVDASGNPMMLGGVINIDNMTGSGTISGTGSVFDLNDAGTLFAAQTVLAANTGNNNASIVSVPDTYGLVTIKVNTSCTLWACDFADSLIYDGYMIDQNHIALVENWFQDDAGGVTGGLALAQTGAGMFSASSVSGNTYVISTNGADLNGVLQLAGALTFNSDGSVTGNLSFNDIATQSTQGGVALAAEGTPACSTTMATTACYTVDSSGTGRVNLTNVTDNATFGYNLELYLTGDGHAAVISMDNNDAVAGGSWQQSSGLNAASLSGSYAAGLSQNAGNSDIEQDGVGEFFADGTSSLSGFVNLNESLTTNTLNPDTVFSGTYAAGSANGVLTVNGPSPTLFTGYLIDNTQGVLIENDDNGLTLGYFGLQQ